MFASYFKHQRLATLIALSVIIVQYQIRRHSTYELFNKPTHLFQNLRHTRVLERILT